ncbi:putative ribonuclease H-like domain-containing protein [Tanacetum coccineum]
MVSTVKLLILKKGEYTLWSMMMKQYLTNTDYSLWQVILNGDSSIQVTTDEKGVKIEVPPKTAQALLQRQSERKAKSILLLAIPDEYQLRFHGIKDAKSLWAAIKSRFGGNVESKKMQKTILKQQFENFYVSDTEGVDKAYDRFQKLISLLEVHGAVVPNEDANQKFLRALPSSWNNVALIMRNKDGIDDLDIYDLYNNLKVFEANIKEGAIFQGNVEHQEKQGKHEWRCNGNRSKDNTSRTCTVDDLDVLVVQGPDTEGNPQQALKNQGIFESGCSMHMTVNKDFLIDYQELDGGFVAFGGSARGELKFNLFSVSQMRDKKNSVLFTKTECLVLSLDFKLLDESQKGKQHKASCKSKLMSSISQPLQMLHMDLFGPTSVRSINHKTYCLVVTDDFSRFSWVFFLASKDETSGILKRFITEIENQLNHKVKVIRCDNETEFKNREMNELCGLNGIKREFSVARTPQQNGVAERKNRTLIEAARTMLADSLLPTVFWAEAVNTACYVLNRVLVTKPHNKTPYELIIGRPPSISFMRPFGCHVTILNTLDPLGKFDGKAEEGFLVGYSVNSKAFRVFNSQTRKVKENLHVNFLENKPNVAGQGPNWLFDIDSLTNSMNYQPVTAGNQTNKNAGPQEANGDTGSGYQQKDRKPSQNDKTEHGMEKTVQNQGQSPKMPKSESILKNQQSNRSRN